MNMWGFTPDYFKGSAAIFEDFLDKNINELKKEYYIPYAVDCMIKGQGYCGDGQYQSGNLSPFQPFIEEKDSGQCRHEHYADIVERIIQSRRHHPERTQHAIGAAYVREPQQRSPAHGRPSQSSCQVSLGA